MRRTRRGHQRWDEYAYACDETCARCGGDWRFDVGVIDDGVIVEGGGGGDEEEDDEDNNDDHEDADDREHRVDMADRTRLIRCKDCMGAFHVGCMMMHGGGGRRIRRRRRRG